MQLKSRYLQEDEFSGLELKIDYKLNAAETHVLYRINGNGWIFDKEFYELIETNDKAFDRLCGDEIKVSSELLNKIAEHHFKYEYFSNYKCSNVVKGVWNPDEKNTEREGYGFLTADGFVWHYIDIENEAKSLLGLEF